MRDRKEAIRRTDEAIARVDAAALQEWKDDAYRAVMKLALYNEEFTTDLVWDEVETPYEPRALGPVMRRCVREGLCEDSGRVMLSDRPERHRAPIRVWRSRVWHG